MDQAVHDYSATPARVFLSPPCSENTASVHYRTGCLPQLCCHLYWNVYAEKSAKS